MTMIEKVVTMALPVNENLVIPRNRIEPKNQNDNRGRISIVTGAHGVLRQELEQEKQSGRDRELAKNRGR